jgi:hypothetical protein
MKLIKPIFRVNLYFLIILIVEIVGPMFLTNNLYKYGFSTGATLVIAHFTFFIIPAVIYLIITKSSPKDVLRLNRPRVQDILWAVLIGIVAQPVMMFLSLISSFFFDNDVAKFMANMEGTPYWVMLLIIAVTPSITEEITVRGIILSGYNQKNKYIAAIMSGIIFGLFHLNGQQFLYATALGVLFGYLVRITNSIFITMAAHFTINGFQVTMQKFIFPLLQNISEDKDQSIKTMSLEIKLSVISTYGILAIIFGTILVLIIKNIEKKNILRGVVQPNENIELERSYVNEKVVNLPFIITLILYFVIITFFQ